MKHVATILCVLSILCATSDAGAAEGTRRFALIVGSNDGGPGRVHLNYAVSDATSFARVVEELGGVSAKDRVILTEPDLASFRAVLAGLSAQLNAARAAGGRIELLFYYSGHSDEQGLLFGKDRYPYPELRQAITGLPADVRVIILDSCSSGALTRTKGGAHKPPFLIDGSVNVKGYAFLTSSSADEAAQESDRIKASFFTHYLVSGLRGAADLSGDGQVTLNEAYQYAFAETLARTESTRSGAQHPAYDMQLAGSGDLVMTDLRDTSAKVILDEDIGGRLFVRSEAGALAVEVNKPRDRAVEVGLSPGFYTVTLDVKGKIYRAEITLREGAKVRVGARQFVRIDAELTAARGPRRAPPTGGPGVDDEYGTLGEAGEYLRVPFNVALVPSLSINESVQAGRERRRVLNNVALNLVYGESDALHGIAVGFGNGVREEAKGLMAAYLFNLILEPQDSIKRPTMTGLMAAGFFNIATADIKGLQGAGFFNYTHGRMKGLQGAGFFNYNEEGLRGLQCASIFNMTGGPLTGIQAAAIFNHVDGRLTGLQGAAILNWHGPAEARGAQASAVVNYSEGPFTGAQFSGVASTATGDFRGAQLSGVLNIAGDIRGAQIGLLNAAREVTGAQIGLINVADDVEGVSLALLPIVKNGYNRFTVWGGDVQMVNAGVKLGGRKVYTLLGAGLNPDVSPARWSAQLGLGGHIPLARGLFIDVDLVTASVHYGSEWEPSALGSFRVVAGWEPAQGQGAAGEWGALNDFAFYAGPTLNAFVSDRHEGRDMIRFGLGEWRSGEWTTRLWPGFVAGVQM